MVPPEGFAPTDGKVCLLRKGVEGLKQGANGFMKLNASTITKLGLKRSMLDPNIYSRVTDGVTLHVGCYVDNLLAAHTKGDKGRALCALFFKKYSEMIKRELRGPPKVFMGVQIEYNIAKGCTRRTTSRRRSISSATSPPSCTRLRCRQASAMRS